MVKEPQRTVGETQRVDRDLLDTLTQLLRVPHRGRDIAAQSVRDHLREKQHAELFRAHSANVARRQQGCEVLVSAVREHRGERVNHPHDGISLQHGGGE